MFLYTHEIALFEVYSHGPMVLTNSTRYGGELLRPVSRVNNEHDYPCPGVNVQITDTPSISLRTNKITTTRKAASP